MCKEEIADAADVRQPRHADRYQATPGIVDPDPSQLRKDLQHLMAYERVDIRGWRWRISFAAAEDKSAIIADAEIIHYETAVADRKATGDEPFRPIQRFSGYKIVGDRHDPAGYARFKSIQQCVTRQHAISRPHTPLLAVRDYALARFHAHDT